jgi:hypothetical protein
MLALVGEDAVNSLVTNVTAEVALAIRTLTEVNRQLQARGWQWNIETEVTITANGDSKFPWQQDWIRVDTDRGRYSDVDLVRRGAFLFNAERRKNTEVFTHGTLKVNIVRYLSWVTLPETARQYMLIKAARIFCNRVMGDEVRAGYAKLDEDDAWRNLLEAETEQADYNFMATGAPAEANRGLWGPLHLPTH